MRSSRMSASPMASKTVVMASTTSFLDSSVDSAIMRAAIKSMSSLLVKCFMAAPYPLWTKNILRLHVATKAAREFADGGFCRFFNHAHEKVFVFVRRRVDELGSALDLRDLCGQIDCCLKTS